MWVGGHRHAPAVLTPGKIRYSLYRRLGGPQGRSGRDSATFLPCTSVRHSGHVRHVQWLFAPLLNVTIAYSLRIKFTGLANLWKVNTGRSVASGALLRSAHSAHTGLRWRCVRNVWCSGSRQNPRTRSCIAKMKLPQFGLHESFCVFV